MNRKRKLLPLLILTLAVACCFINFPAYCETDSETTQNTTSQEPLPSAAATSNAPVPSKTFSAVVSKKTTPSSKISVSSKKASSYKPKKRTVKKVSLKQSSSTDVSNSVSSEAPSSEISSGSAVSLPSVGSIPENDIVNSAAENQGSDKQSKWVGLISWACIILGVLVIVIVLLSNRRPPRGPGHKRYRRPKRRKKHLLPDKYYRGIGRY